MKILNFKIVFTFFKIKNCFSTKDKTPYFLKSFLVYKFVCARCNSCYIDETCHHLKTVKKGTKYNIYKHLRNNEECFPDFNPDCFSILNYSPTQFQFIIRKDMSMDKPNLNQTRSQILTNN